jgi:hypothetical protein
VENGLCPETCGDAEDGVVIVVVVSMGVGAARDLGSNRTSTGSSLRASTETVGGSLGMPEAKRSTQLSHATVLQKPAPLTGVLIPWLGQLQWLHVGC